MSKYPFDELEMEIVERVPNRARPEDAGKPVYHYPVSAKEAIFSLYRKQGLWMPNTSEIGIFCPAVIPDDIARGFVFEELKMPIEEYGGKDMFGVEWVFVPVVGGSMEKPGVPHLFHDANEWKDKIVWPDIYAWDWDESGRSNQKFLDNGKANFLWILNGAWFERLISFMGFEDAAVAMIDEEQEDAVKELFAQTTDLYCKIIDLCCDAYGENLAGFTVHDDWGSQRAPFFSFDAGREMIVPYMKQLTDHIKARGKLADLHSCGHLEAQIQNFIDGGWESWTPMPMNDTKKLYKEYGDKIILGIVDDPLPEGATAQQQADQAAAFAEEYYAPDKPSQVSLYGGAVLTDAYCDSLYRTTRKMC